MVGRGRRREGVRRGREVREGEIVGVWRWEGGRERGRVGGSDSVRCARVTVRNVPVAPHGMYVRRCTLHVTVTLHLCPAHTHTKRRFVYIIIMYYAFTYVHIVTHIHIRTHAHTHTHTHTWCPRLRGLFNCHP